jgi:ABC-type branched-subunit amino acid transport system substrate-binding protein
MTSSRQRIRVFAFGAMLALLTLACGQKPGVHEQVTGAGAGGAGSGLGGTESGAGGGTGAGTEGSAAGGGGTAGGGTGGGGGGGAAGGGAGGGGAAASGPADRTGITKDSITIGIHAPVTGAAPFPADAFALGRDIYWTWSGAPKINGRTVKVLFEDDQYSPVTARDRCRKMAEQQKAFMLIGGGGTDQIQACAQYAAGTSIPYLSAGVTEIGVDTLPNYFAISMSYAQQGELLWQLITKDNRLKGSTANVAMVRTDTPNFDDAHQAFLDAANKRGKKLVYDRTLPKNPTQNDYNQTALELNSAGAEVVYILVAPTHYVQLTARLAPGYRPWWVGVGITMGLNAVLETGCNTSNNAIDKALFFSPFPGLDKIDSLDPNYRKAYREKNPGEEPDDIGVVLWGLNKTLHEMFKNVGADLSRQSFISKTQSGAFTSNVFPPQKYTPQNHFGSSQVHLLKANCNTGQHVTEKMFVGGF